MVDLKGLEKRRARDLGCPTAERLLVVDGDPSCDPCLWQRLSRLSFQSHNLRAAGLLNGDGADCRISEVNVDPEARQSSC